MFQELMPLLAQRTLILILSRANENEVRVNVIPKPLRSDARDENNALTTPLSVTGSPKELDEGLADQLSGFVQAHLELSSTLMSAREQMEAAAKAAREAAKKSTTSQSPGRSSRSVSPRPQQVQAEDETGEKPDDSQSGPEPSQATTVGTGSVAPGASSGSLFEIESKNDQ